MDGKSRLPTMIKKPMVRTQVPSDRLVGATNGPNKTLTATGVRSNLANRTALTSFENVLHNLRNGTNTQNKPLKRHASPEFRSKKTQAPVFKKLRRSRSVSDMYSVPNADQNQKHGEANSQFAMPSGPAPKSAVTRPLFVPPKSKPVVPMKAKPVAKPAPRPAHKVLKLNSGVGAKKEDAKPKAPVGKKIPAYDFKARFQDLSEKHKMLKEKHEQLKDQLGDLAEYEECRAELSNLQAEYQSVQEQLVSLQQQTSGDQQKIKSLNDELNAKIEECRIVTEAKERITEKYTSVNAENSELKISKTVMEGKLKTQDDRIEELMQELKDAGEQLYRAGIERKELHNTIMDLRGNIRVFCRVRPPLQGEETRTLCSWQHNDDTSLEIASFEACKKPVKHEFSFDQVFRPNSLQEDIFEQVSPLIQSALDGYNVCIFAYGQTGSGKTFTMDGAHSAQGIIPRTIDLLFDCFQQNKRLGWKYTLNASALEIYNETLFDLLSNEAKDLEIRMVSAKTPTDIYVSNLTDVVVQNKDELHELMQLAKANRATAATVGNERSSRSHSVTQLRLYGEHATKNEITVSTINLIDLAGSESPKTSVRMEETKKINKSLSELTNVIMALLQKHDHIPYRNSKLTHLLMPSLGGNSKTLMFVNVSPFQDCFVETVKSLRFAASVNNCKMNKAKKNKYFTSQTSTTNTTLNGSN